MIHSHSFFVSNFLFLREYLFLVYFYAPFLFLLVVEGVDENFVLKIIVLSEVAFEGASAGMFEFSLTLHLRLLPQAIIDMAKSPFKFAKAFEVILLERSGEN